MLIENDKANKASEKGQLFLGHGTSLVKILTERTAKMQNVVLESDEQRAFNLYSESPSSYKY